MLTRRPLWIRVLMWLTGATEVELLLPNANAAAYLGGVAHEIAVADESISGDRHGWRARCSCGWVDTSRPELEADLQANQHRAQGFFADIANEMRRPHFGEMQAGFMRALLTRAEEAKLYRPENP